MDLDLVVDALRVIIAAYLLLIAVLAPFNLHRELLAYPPRALYAGVRLLVLAVTLGNVRLTPLAKRVKRRQARRLRSLRFALNEWQERRAEEKALERGEELQPQVGGWAGGQGTTGVPQAATPPAPVPSPPPAQPDQESLPELPDFKEGGGPPQPPRF